MLPYGLARWALFRLDPERAHAVAARYLEWLGSTHGMLARTAARHHVDDPRLRVEALGTRFDNPLGVAAGFDKDARMVPALGALGFGHVEVGTVTPQPQPGNAPPRVWRAPGSQALVNRLGFPSEGAGAVAGRLSDATSPVPLGMNVGPNKEHVGDDMPEHVASALGVLAAEADYVAVNVSSPNTPGLRRWQTPEGVATTVGACLEALDDAGHRRPVLVKLHPDADDDALGAQCRGAVDAGAAGVIATNTTTARPPGVEHLGEGGLSGPPLRARSTAVVRLAAAAVGDEGVVVGVGGVTTGRDALEKIAAGAALVQAYTGFIYRGPGFARAVNGEIVALLDALGIDSLAEVAELGPDVIEGQSAQERAS